MPKSRHIRAEKRINGAWLGVSEASLRMEDEGCPNPALVDFALAQVARTGTGVPTHHRGRMRFEMELAPRGWKIVDFRPKGFFQ